MFSEDVYIYTVCVVGDLSIIVVIPFLKLVVPAVPLLGSSDF